MSTDSKNNTPLVTHRSYIDVHLMTMVFTVLVVLGGIIPMFLSEKFPWMKDGWTLLPSVVFLAVITAAVVVQVRNGSVTIKESSEKVALYLVRNYGILVDPKACAEYCDNPSVTSDKIINAEDCNSGKSIRVTLRFSKDYTSVMPLLADVPLKNTKIRV